MRKKNIAGFCIRACIFGFLDAPVGIGGITMKIAVVTSVLSLLFVFLLPLALIKSEPLQPEQMEQEEELPAETEEEQAPAPAPAGEREPYTADAETTISLLAGGEIREITMDKYLWGVTAAEMPAGFEPEALKAQAVAARTYALWRLSGSQSSGDEAQLSDDSASCQAYRSPEEMAEKWGEDAEAYAAKIEQAVSATDGKVILYDGKVIEALYHSSTSGYTEDALAVWGTDIPYLCSVVSPEDSADVPDYYSVQRIPAAEFRERFLEAYPAADLGGGPGTTFQNLTRSRTGSVISVDLGGVYVTGIELRTLFSLRSTAFSVGTDGEDVVFSIIGYGHGVGMSQYGANVLAQSGMDYVQILGWYYTGTSVSDYAAGGGT
jgi:stage II sporulation protein D